MVLMIALVQQKKINITFDKAKTKYCLNLRYNDDETYLYVNKTEICKLKANDNLSWYTFCLGSASKDFSKDEQNKFL